MLSFDGGTHDPANFEAVRAWVRESIDAAGSLAGSGGAYLGFSADAATDRAVVEQQYGGNLDRLKQVKRAVDPDNLFRINNNITPD
jgi:FAD/FMN-containing dehydrogenase